MTSLTQRLLSAEAKRRKEGASSSKVRGLLASLSEKQRAFVTDRGRFKVAVCPRRAGKSISLCAYMVAECMRAPDTPVLYLALTRESAKAAVWDVLLRMLDEHDIGYDARPSALHIKFHNGSFIQLFGGDTPNSRHRLRGRKFKLVCVDEAGFVNDSHFDELIYAILPALADLKGTMAMASSPGEVMDGFFYHAYAGDMKASWSQHHWDLLDNPLFMQPSDNPLYKTRGEEELDTICNLQFGGNREHPAFLREYRGRYVQDNSKLIYPFTKDNLLDASHELPDETHAIGVDFGVSSESAIVVLKFSPYTKECHFVDSWSRKNATVDELAAEIMSRQEKFKTFITIADTGGLGAASAQELRSRYHMSITAADKKDKVFFQRMMANDLLSGYIKVVRGLGLIDEWSKLTKDEFGEELKGQKNHEADAALYVYRYCYARHIKHAQPKETTEQIMVRQLVEEAYREQQEAEVDNF